MNDFRCESCMRMNTKPFQLLPPVPNTGPDYHRNLINITGIYYATKQLNSKYVSYINSPLSLAFHLIKCILLFGELA